MIETTIENLATAITRQAEAVEALNAILAGLAAKADAQAPKKLAFQESELDPKAKAKAKPEPEVPAAPEAKAEAKAEAKPEHKGPPPAGKKDVTREQIQAKVRDLLNTDDSTKKVRKAAIAKALAAITGGTPKISAVPDESLGKLMVELDVIA